MDKEVASDRQWLIPVALIAVFQLALCYLVGAQIPAFVSFTLLAYVVFALVMLGRYLWLLLRMARSGERAPLKRTVEMLGRNRTRIVAVVLGVQVLAFGGSAFNSLKVALPRVVPFWADAPFATMEQQIFTVHPWQVLHAMFGWATPAIDLMYSLWFPIAVVATYGVLAMAPSPLKTRAMVSQALIWLILGIGGAYLFSSAGPLFYDRIHGGDLFAPLLETLHRNGASIAIRTSDMLWLAYSANSVEVGTGISAMPSLHVAIALWLALVLHQSRFRAVGWTYYAFVWVGSVHLGWHYAADGLVASIGTIVIWQATPRFLSVFGGIKGAKISRESVKRRSPWWEEAGHTVAPPAADVEKPEFAIRRAGR